MTAEGGVKKRLSVCLIVRNEAVRLPGCLDSLSNLGAEIIVCDTGSNDETVAVAENFGARVIHFPWSDDFSQARNASIEPASGQWILWLDADERLAPESVPGLKEFTERDPEGPVACIVNIRNSKNNGKYTFLSTAHRLFSNGFGIRFSGTVHEQISPSVAAMKGREIRTDIHIDHLGYDLPAHEMEKKYSRNLDLLKKNIKDKPADAYLNFTLGKQYAVLGDHLSAYHCLKKAAAVKLKDEALFCSILNSLAETCYYLDRDSEAAAALEKSVKLQPKQIAAYYLDTVLRIKTGDWEKALMSANILRDKLEMIAGVAGTIANDVALSPAYVNSLRAEILFSMGKGEEAMDLARDVLSADPSRERLRAFYVDALLRNNEIESALEALSPALELYGDKKYHDMYVRLLIRLQKFEAAAGHLESMIHDFPGSTEDVKLLAGLYAKTGNMDAAAALLSKL